MSRYSRRPPRACDDEDYDPPLIPDLTVPDHESVDTGLLWADGSTIWRDPNPIGFGRNDEW
ncbi:hypothetical protein ABC347_07685 [Sphingomonas sp. 1P06PA]|uniref:hypothetical protein n=1 Tax=Sphingomonas sp. 1P06PA TaxID=554121 RepID=UPI0039A5098F